MMAIAAAMNTVEYVPLMMPTSIVKAKPSRTSPPNRYSATTLRSVVPAVMTVRPEGLIDRDVDDLRQVVAPHAAHVLAHAVEDDDRVVDRVAGDREEAGDDVERHVVAKEGEKRERDQEVVQRRRDGSDREADLESQGDVGQDAREREDRRQDPLALELLADDRPDDLGADDLERPEIRLLERGHDGIGILTQIARALRRRLRDADHDHVLGGVAVVLDDGVVPNPVGQRRHGRSDAIDGGRLLELDDDDAAASEVDAEREPPGRDGGRAGQDHEQRQADGVPAPPHEVIIRRFENLHEVT